MTTGARGASFVSDNGPAPSGPPSFLSEEERRAKAAGADVSQFIGYRLSHSFLEAVRLAGGNVAELSEE